MNPCKLSNGKELENSSSKISEKHHNKAIVAVSADPSTTDAYGVSDHLRLEIPCHDLRFILSYKV